METQRVSDHEDESPTPLQEGTPSVQPDHGTQTTPMVEIHLRSVRFSSVFFWCSSVVEHPAGSNKGWEVEGSTPSAEIGSTWRYIMSTKESNTDVEKEEDNEFLKLYTKAMESTNHLLTFLEKTRAAYHSIRLEKEDGQPVAAVIVVKGERETKEIVEAVQRVQRKWDKAQKGRAGR